MRVSLQSLPVVHNWDCHACGDCCREYEVHITPEEKARIEAQAWETDPEMKGVQLFREHKGQWRLNHRASDDGCVFLNEKGLCRIHAKFGEPTKPLACRVYPFILIPVDKTWRVGLRFACPSVTKNIGRSVESHLPAIKDYAAELENRESVKGRAIPAPPLQKGQEVPWDDLGILSRHFQAIVTEREGPIEWKLRLILALAAICREAKFDKISGKRMTEFLDVLTTGIEDEIPKDPADLAAPGWIGRILFRSIAAVFYRKDKGPQQGISRKGRIALLGAAWRFARGTGKVPKTHKQIPDTTFEDAEKPSGGLPPGAEELFTRYFRVKFESQQFYGATNHNRAFWDGLEALLLTFPVVCWLARVLHDRPREEAFRWALQIVDDNFGFNKLLDSKRYVFSTRTLAKRGELARLIAWYSR